MTNTNIYIDLEEEIQNILVENNVNIEDIINESTLNADVSYGAPSHDNINLGSRTKNIVPIILASSILIPAIGFSIAQVINSLYDKPYFVEYLEKIELRGTDGEILLNSEGNPIFKTVRQHKLIEPQKENLEREFEANFDISNGMVLRFKTQEKE